MRHPRRIVLFLALSLADFFLTWWLLHGVDSPGGEANPLAAWCLAQSGWLGLACFKAGAVLAAVTAAAALGRHYPETAGRVLGLGCLTLAGVVGYSASVALVPRLYGSDDLDVAAARAEQDRLHLVIARLRVHDPVTEPIVADVVARRRTLAEAAVLLARSEAGRDAAWLAMACGPYGRLPQQEALACWVYNRAVRHLGAVGTAEGWAAARLLLRELGQTLGRDLPGGLPLNPPDPNGWRGYESVAGAGAEEWTE